MTISITDKRRVALAYDGSEDACKLFDWAVKNIFRPESDHVILLSAIQRNSTQTKHKSETEMAEEIDSVKCDTRGLLKNLCKELEKKGISSEEHILWGDAKTLLPRYTQSHKVELLIMGSRGLGAVKSVFLGSVSDICLKECPCPVLVVRNATI